MTAPPPLITGRVASLRVGLPQTQETATGRPWETAIYKTETREPIALVGENLEGDYQANRRYHGGPDKAVCFYPGEHYPGWQAAGYDLEAGAFGENVTLAGLLETDICIGDVLAVGDQGTLLQISQPRQPCVNVAKRTRRPDLPQAMIARGWTGFYARVTREGTLAAGDVVTLLERPHPGWTVARANSVMYGADADPEEVAALRDVPLLSREWRRMLGRKLAKGK